MLPTACPCKPHLGSETRMQLPQQLLHGSCRLCVSQAILLIAQRMISNAVGMPLQCWRNGSHMPGLHLDCAELRMQLLWLAAGNCKATKSQS